jgi:hypothetical protein
LRKISEAAVSNVSNAQGFDFKTWITRAKYSRGKGLLTFSPEAMMYFAGVQSRMYQVNMSIFQLDWPVAYQLANWFTLYYEYTKGDAGKNNGVRLKVRTLIDTLTELPRLDETKKNNYTRNIREPLEKALDMLVERKILNMWQYTWDRGKALTEAERDNAGFSEWLDLCVEYSLNLPAQEKYVEASKKAKVKRERVTKAQKQETAPNSTH